MREVVLEVVCPDPRTILVQVLGLAQGLVRESLQEVVCPDLQTLLVPPRSVAKGAPQFLESGVHNQVIVNAGGMIRHRSCRRLHFGEGEGRVCP